MKNLIIRLNKVEEYTAASLLIATSLIVFIQVLLRFIFSYSLFWAEEMSLLLIVWFIFLGSSMAVRENAHAGMDAIEKIVPKPIGYVMRLLTCIICVVFCGVITVAGWNNVISIAHVGATSTAMRIPLFVPYASLPVGLLFMTIRYIAQLFELIRNPKGTTEVIEL